MKREGIEVTHATARSTMIVVDVAARPYGEAIACPTCRIVHLVKAVHLWVDDRGSCIVSKGVLEDLRRAGLPGLTVGPKIKNPPTLTIGAKVDRAEVDFKNRSQTIYNGQAALG